MKHEIINLLTEHMKKVNHQIIDFKYNMITKKQFLKNIEQLRFEFDKSSFELLNQQAKKSL